jgi:hypothetical protein
MPCRAFRPAFPCRGPKGDIYLKPLAVPKETLDVKRIVVPPSGGGGPRLAAGPIEPGDYELIWQGDIEAAVLRKIR